LQLLPLHCSPVTPGSNEPVKILNHTPAVQFVRWTDPRENAFWTEAPAGWRASGGLFRYSPIDTREAVQAVSTDGIRISMGDADISAFVAPNPMLNAGGFREGSRYPNGYGGFMPVAQYRPGMQFAEEYARTKAAAPCAGFTVVGRMERPELSQSLNRILATMPGMNVRMTTGEVFFTCTKDGQPMRGYYFAGTIFTLMSSGLTMWFLQHLYGYIAPAGKAGMAQVALRRMVAAHQVNPSWAAMQSSITMKSSQIMAQSNAEISKIISDSYWGRARSQDNTFRHDANARRGTTDVVDPETGETWNVTGGRRHYWRIPGSDVVIGTDTYDRPHMNAVPLTEY
jgi:hypothetical protein